MKLRKQYLREYRIWKDMRARCYSKCNKETTYQKKGIKCCREWKSFEKFLSDMGPCPDNYSIDRIDNNGDYCPSNCRWVSQKVQCNNRGRFTPIYNYKGSNHTLKEWSNILKINYNTLRYRVLHLHLSIKAAIEYSDPRKELLEWKGKKYTRQELSIMYNIPLINFYDRMHKGWTLKKILETPIHKI